MRIFDAHLHVVDPRFALAPEDAYAPAPFTAADYRARTASLGISGGAVVAASFQGTEQAHLLDALRELGPSFVGVAQLPPRVTDAELLALDAAGMRAMRVNLVRRTADLDVAARLAARIADLAGWHVELYVDARDLPDVAPRLGPPERLVVDHLGLSQAGLPAVVALASRGGGVKASGFGRGDLDVPAALRAIAAANPAALMFGTDLPSTRAPRPFTDADLDVLLDALGDDLGGRALYDNAAARYRLAAPPDDDQSARPVSSHDSAAGQGP